MAINSKELEQDRKKLDEIKKADLDVNLFKWEKVFDKWLKNHPYGGTYSCWVLYPISHEIMIALKELYGNQGWLVEGGGYSRYRGGSFYDIEFRVKSGS